MKEEGEVESNGEALLEVGKKEDNGSVFGGVSRLYTSVMCVCAYSSVFLGK